MRYREYGKKGKKRWKKTVRRYNKAVKKAGYFGWFEIY
jgi:hypothetical protein